MAAADQAGVAQVRAWVAPARALAAQVQALAVRVRALAVPDRDRVAGQVGLLHPTGGRATRSADLATGQGTEAAPVSRVRHSVGLLAAATTMIRLPPGSLRHSPSRSNFLSARWGNLAAMPF